MPAKSPEAVARKRERDREACRLRSLRRAERQREARAFETEEETAARRAGAAERARRSYAGRDEAARARGVERARQKQAVRTRRARAARFAALPRSAVAAVLAQLRRLVPSYADRDDVVAEAALRLVEGYTLDEAIKLARKAVQASAYEVRHGRKIERWGFN